MYAAKKSYFELLTELKIANTEYASLVSVSPSTLPEIQKTLDPDLTLLSYLVTGEKTLAFIVTAARVEAVELPVGKKELRKKINALRDFPDLDSPPYTLLSQLYAELVAPLESKLTTQLVGIIPSGPLYFLPFSALYDGQKYFDDAHALFVLPSASALKFIRAKVKPAGRGLVAFSQGTAPGFPSLRFADREATRIASLFGGTAVTTPQATKTTFLAQSANANIIHIAAHGIDDKDSVWFSRLYLAQAGEDDGELPLHEIFSLTLSEANLVVLSACETDLGSVGGAEDLVGMSTAFIYAGTPSFVGSLWSVDDQSTSFLMERFYRYLLNGSGTAIALQEARRDTRQKYPHPYYWAPFVLTGFPGVSKAAGTQ